jgi:hypothetical protein
MREIRTAIFEVVYIADIIPARKQSYVVLLLDTLDCTSDRDVFFMQQLNIF